MFNRTRTFALALAAPLLAAPAFAPAAAAAPAGPAPVHGFAMHGAPKYGPDFAHFDYANPGAPKGGAVVAEASRTYDSLNPFILKGLAAAGIGLVYDTLMTPSADEPFTYYGLVAEGIEVPEDRSWVAFRLDPRARWHDGRPIVADDVAWTFETLVEVGHPFYRSYYADVESVEKDGDRRVVFRFAGGGANRELPLIVAQMVVLPKHYWEGRDFAATTLEPPLGSGPYRISGLEAGRSISYERVRDYWAADLPANRGRWNFDSIRYEYYRDRDVATEAFKSGAFDLRQENSAKRWATAFEFPAREAGMAVKLEIPHENSTHMQGFVFNARKPLFRDPRVRRALTGAFDFEWTNETVMYGAYTRTESYFSNTELSSRRAGLPSGEELDILEGLRGRIPEEVFTTVYEAPETDGSGNIRRNLRAAFALLREAGWRVGDDRKLRNAAGEAFAFELLLAQPSMEKIALPFKDNLERLGVDMSVRTVDPAQYQSRVDNFDFDMIVNTFGQSLSPGNEQRNYWHSERADTPGSGNLIGVRDPAVDELVELVIAAPSRESLVARTRALDRVLLWSHYVVPHFHSRAARLVFWNRFGRPATVARHSHGYPSTWWIDPEKDAALARWREGGGD